MTEPSATVIAGAIRPFELTRRQIGWTLSAHFLSSASIGVAIGGIVPLISVTLEAREVDTVIIGVNSAMTSIGVILAAPFVPSIVRALGAGWAIVSGLLFATLATLGLGLVDELWVWLLLRLLMGVGVVTHWVVSETWMQEIVSERRRGLVMSVYVTSIAAGFASGPVVLSFTGTEGFLPFIVFATMIGLTALPMIPIRHLVPPLALNERGSALRLMRQAPTIATAALAPASCQTESNYLLSHPPTRSTELRSGMIARGTPPHHIALPAAPSYPTTLTHSNQPCVDRGPI